LLYNEDMRKKEKDVIVYPPKALSDPKYKGKHILLDGDKVVAVGDWKKIDKAMERLYKKGKTPSLAYVPKSDTLILPQC